MKNNLNVFTYGYLPFRFRNIPYNIAQFFKNCKHAWHRAIKGYCKYDRWDLDLYYTKLLIETLCEFRDNLHGYPGDEEFPTFGSWYDYIDEIIYHLENSVEDVSKEDDRDYRRSERSKALIMLDKCWDSLWD